MNDINYDHFTSKTPFDAERDYGSDYASVYFRIDASWYRYPYTDYPGRYDKESEFYDEVRLVFESNGWEFCPSKFSGACPEAKRGQERLYLHPQSFSGVVLKNHIAEIAWMLGHHDTFKYLCTDVYETVHAMDDAEYQAYLEDHKTAIQKKLVKAFETRRRTVFKMRSDVVMRIAALFCLSRIGKQDEKHGYTADAYCFTDSVCDGLITAGWLIPEGTKDGNLVRAANKTERHARKLNEEDL